MLFRMWDLDSTNCITKEELSMMFFNLQSANSSTQVTAHTVTETKKVVDFLVNEALKSCDFNRDNTLSFEQFKYFIVKNPGLTELMDKVLNSFFWARDTTNGFTKSTSVKSPQVVDLFGAASSPRRSVGDPDNMIELTVPISDKDKRTVTTCEKCNYNFYINSAPGFC
eukprot:UN31470